MSAQNDTPKTDAARFACPGRLDGDELEPDVVQAEFARRLKRKFTELERQLSARGAELETLISEARDLAREVVQGCPTIAHAEEVIDLCDRARASLRAPQSMQQQTTSVTGVPGEFCLDRSTFPADRKSTRQGEWQVVPKEPADAMVMAGDACCPITGTNGIRRAWRAMLSAAPSAPAARGWAIKGPDDSLWVANKATNENEAVIAYQYSHLQGEKEIITCVPVLIVEDKR